MKGRCAEENTFVDLFQLIRTWWVVRNRVIRVTAYPTIENVLIKGGFKRFSYEMRPIKNSKSTAGVFCQFMQKLR